MPWNSASFPVYRKLDREIQPHLSTASCQSSPEPPPRRHYRLPLSRHASRYLSRELAPAYPSIHPSKHLFGRCRYTHEHRDPLGLGRWAINTATGRNLWRLCHGGQGQYCHVIDASETRHWSSRSLDSMLCLGGYATWGHAPSS